MDKVKAALKIFVPAILALIVTNVSNIFFVKPQSKIVFGIIANILFAIIFVICWKIYDGYISAKIELWKIGQIKGLWKGSGLNRQVTKAFLKANEIKIKVTRGSELLKSENNHSIKKVLNKIYAKSRDEQKQVYIKILLIEPCFQLKHVKDRYKRHKSSMSEKDFITSWYDFLLNLHKLYPPHDFFSYEVRFYSGRHSKWRYYVCNVHEKNITTVLLSSYDVNTSGSSTPMYKIIRGDMNIGGFMDRYFEEVWNESLTEEDLIKHILAGTCKRYFCEMCFTCGYKDDCSSCQKCNYEKECKKIVNDYLKRVNRNILTVSKQ